LDCPFRTVDQVLQEVNGTNPPKVIIVDFHAEATSEKQAMAWYLNGRVSAVVGTHTHVATADARILPEGTAYVTDVGMTGPYNSVIGSDIRAVLDGFITQMPQRFTVPKGPVILNSVLVDMDEEKGVATNIQRIDRMVN
jgi:metallophosphoesterase (TIGR00282 family)